MLRNGHNFLHTLHQHSIALERGVVEVVQVNVGRLCNQACLHCHVEAGPKRTEIMSEDVAERILAVLTESPQVHTVDVTGGAPELAPVFRRLVEQAVRQGKQVWDRCNLTVFFEEGQEDLPKFLREHQVKIVASLPCYSETNVDSQRGTGVFQKSIQALRLLNELGYGTAGSGLELCLVYNPLGASLPPAQNELEQAYREQLRDNFEIEFTSLYTITNMPINRFLHQLKQMGKYEEYMRLLVQNFNPEAAWRVMCRSLISVGWKGEIFDCDFNQMLNLPLGGQQRNIWDIESFQDLSACGIQSAEHCFGCTAGAGSSCGGVLVDA